MSRMGLHIALMVLACFWATSLEVRGYKELPHCVRQDESGSVKMLVFVSTLDGRMTALNAVSGGMVVWSIDTGPGPLLSSSIDKLELTSNGHWVRMIPSLNGGIYKFDGVSIESVPVTADHLLQSSSLLLNDGLVISGGKESRIYGIASETGEVLYECSMKGCDNYNISDKVVLIQRHTKTVRAIDIYTGTERWNFSVGQHEVKYSFSSTCHTKQAEMPTWNFDLKAVLPEGLICAIDKEEPEKILWKHKFDSPIVAIWQMDNGEMKPVDLFNDVSLNKETETMEPSAPSLYVGMHKKQLYIQEKKSLWEELRKDTSHLLSHNVIPWRPIPATSSALGITSEQSETTDVALIETTALSILYASEYVNGNGYYLFVDDNSRHANQCSVTGETVSTQENDSASEENTPVNIVIISLWYWWKEVLIISITTAVLVNLLITQRVMHIVQTSSQVIRKEIIVEKPVESKKSTDSSSSTISESSQNSDFVSRYLSDFEPVRCLGKGGFGVVFEAKNKIDDCNYAIKRITLPNREVGEEAEIYFSDTLHVRGLSFNSVLCSALLHSRRPKFSLNLSEERGDLNKSVESRDRVLREVKALAKLDHQHIVRYFNAWMECPPAGWMEQHDSLYLKQDKNLASDIIDIESSYLDDTTFEHNSYRVSVDRDSSQVLSLPNSSSVETRLCQGKCDESDSFIVFEHSEEATGDDRTSDKSGQFSLLFEESADSVSKNGSSFLDCSNFKKKCSDRELSENKDCYIIPIPTRIYLYIQMQLCHRESLREWLSDNDKPRDMCKTFQIFEQIVQAVEYIHLEGLIHRDLKPSNIFFSLNGQIKVGDFGLVTAMDKTIAAEELVKINSCDPTSRNHKHTAEVGTQLYMSPEQVKGEPYDYKVDIYSLGVIFFELLYPFSTQMERINTLLNLRKNIFPSNFQKDFLAEYELLHIMLSHQPEKRPTTFGIRARPPLCQNFTFNREEQKSELHHFELPLQTKKKSKSSLSSCSSVEVN